MAFRRDWPVWSARASTPTVQAGSIDPYDDRVRLFDHGPVVGDPTQIQNYWTSPGGDNAVRLWPVRKNPLLEIGAGMDFSPVGCLARRPSNRSWVNGPILDSFDSWSLGKITPAQAFADTENDHNVWNDGWRRWVRIGPNTLVTYNHYASANDRAAWLAKPANQAGATYNTLFFMGRDDQVHQIQIEPDLDLMDRIVTDTGFSPWYVNGVVLNGDENSDLIFAKFSSTPPSEDVISIARPLEWIQHSTMPATVMPMPVSGYAVGNQNRIARFVTNGQDQSELGTAIDDHDFPWYVEPLVVFDTDSGTPLLAPASGGRVAYVGLASSKTAAQVNTFLDNRNVEIINTALANIGRSSEAIETIAWTELYDEPPASISGPIRPKRTEVAGREPSASQLEVGEIALNLEDGKIFSKKSDGTVVTISNGDASLGLGDLTNVDVQDPAFNHVLFFNQATQTWQSKSFQQTDIATNQGLGTNNTDVFLSPAVSNGAVLTHFNGIWTDIQVSIDASQVTSGTIDTARIPDLPSSKVTGLGTAASSAIEDFVASSITTQYTEQFLTATDQQEAWFYLGIGSAASLDLADVVQLDAQGRLPAIDGSQLTNLPSGVTDHGQMSGLLDDDHTQYALADGSRGAFEASGAVATHAALTSGVHGISAFAATILDDADAAAARTTLGLGTAATSATGDFEASGSVSTHAAVTSGVHGISAFGATLIDDADAAAARTTLGLGTAATSATGDFAAASHTHAATDITSGTLDAARLPAITDSYAMFVETVADKASPGYVVDALVATDRTITGFYAKTESGTCTATLRNITDNVEIGSVSVTSTGGSDATLINTAVTAGERLGVVVSSNASATDLQIVVEYTA